MASETGNLRAWGYRCEKCKRVWAVGSLRDVFGHPAVSGHEAWKHVTVVAMEEQPVDYAQVCLFNRKRPCDRCHGHHPMSGTG